MFDRLVSWNNLLHAYEKASRGKRGQGNVAAFEHRLEEHLLALQRELRERSYRPGAYHSFFIHEPKRRLISAAPFRDRVVHHALVNVIEPLFERAFLDDSFANRVGKGTHRALARCQELSRRFPWCLLCDIRQFFPSIDHAILRRTLARRLSDPGVLWLIDRVLESGAGVLSEAYEMVFFPGDDLFAVNRPRGLPIGNLTSQFWANVYLDPFDHFVKRELGCPGYVRYVDDLLFFASNKAELWAWKGAIEERLERFRLVLHPGAHPRPVTEGVPFLGFVTFPDRRRLKRRKGIHYRRRLRSQLAELDRGVRAPGEVVASVTGWLNHLRMASGQGLAKAVLREAFVGRTYNGREQEFDESIAIHVGGFSMDAALLATALTTFLAPALPYLLNLGGKVAEEAATKLGESTWETAKELWGKLHPKVEAKPAAAEAAQDVAAGPADGDAQAALRLQLRKILEADAALAAELERLYGAARSAVVNQAQVTGSGAIAQDRSVAAGAGGRAIGSVGGDVKIPGRGDREGS